MSVGLRGRGGSGGGGGAGSRRVLLRTGTGRRGRAVGRFDPDGTHPGRGGGRCRRHGGRPARGDGRRRFGLGLEPRAADEVMSFPVFVLAEGSAVASGVAAAARLAGFAAAIPATLRGEKREKKKVDCKFFVLLCSRVLKSINQIKKDDSKV